LISFRRALVGGLLAAIALPAAAQAADYGGGTAVDNVSQFRRQLTIVSVRTRVDGKAFVRAEIQARCGSARVGRTVTPAADGSFTVNATVRGRSGDLRQIAAITVAGTVAGVTGSGTARLKLTFRRGGRVVGGCNSGRRAWQIRAAVPETTVGPPKANSGYYGLTSQAFKRPHAFTLHVDRRAKRVQSAVFDYRSQCRHGAPELNNITPGGRIARDGTFSLRERFTLRFSNSTERFLVKVDGKFTPNGVNGKLSVSSVARSLSGNVIDRCRTGRRTFAAAL
jgi:hypothetical protein